MCKTRLARAKSMLHYKMIMHLCALFLTVVSADWIDPDTPWEARTTMPYNVKPPSIERSNPKITNATNTTKTHRKVHTPAPTVSPEPTRSPTVTPSAYPTYTPRNFELVFSDEFNTPNRQFHDGTDPRWTALNKNDYTNDALHYYSADNAVTDNHGRLVITSEAQDIDIVGFDDVQQKKTHVTKHFKSAMMQSWNKFCFTGGIIEAEVQLPGRPDVGGLWPAFWLLGNLGRHTYVGSSAHVWPWSSLICTKTSFHAQRVSGCDEVVHYGLQTHLGRGAPEIDIFEVQSGNIKANTGPFLKTSVGQPFMSASFQVAPGRPSMRPGNGEWPGPGQWYDGLTAGRNTSLNILFYGNYNHLSREKHPTKDDYWSDAISENRQLGPDHFNRSHVYRLEWDVPSDGKEGYLHWFLDGELVFALNGKSITDAGTGATISTEPSYILLNTAISSQWGFPMKCPDNCDCETYNCNSDNWQDKCGFSDGFCNMMKNDLPQYKINWVRVYQDPSDPVHKVGCSTPERPTRRYIEAHRDLYMTENDKRPLKPIQRGNGPCSPDAVGVIPEACGGSQRGQCTSGKVCQCKPGWTGPQCLAHDGSDPVLYDQPDKISDVGFIPPRVFPPSLMIGLGVLISFLFLTLQLRRRLGGWTPIPDIDYKH